MLKNSQIVGVQNLKGKVAEEKAFPNRNSTKAKSGLLTMKDRLSLQERMVV
jgi:hypothetical protein